MNELRIAFGLLACAVGWVAIAPTSPSLVSFSQTPTVMEAADDVFAGLPEVSDIPPIPPEVSQMVRSVGSPPPVAVPDTETPPVRVAARPQPSEPAGDPQLRLFSRPVAVNAGTLKSGRTTLRVADIEPISPDARCSDGAQSWPCGIRARTAFRSWLRGRSVLCAVPPGLTNEDDLTVSCLAGEADVGEWLVANGWAAPAGSDRYSALGDTAKLERRGIWAFGVAQP